MNQKFKIGLSNFSTWVMIITILIIAIWFFGSIISISFDLNVFTERTSEFLLSLLGTAFVLVICSAFLNISLNISIIADSKIEKINDATSTKKFFEIYTILLLLLIIIIPIILFAGDYFSRKQIKANLYIECKDLIDRNDKILNDISIGLTDKTKVLELPKILNFLENQKNEFPGVTLIVSAKFKDQLTFLKINSWSDSSDLVKEFYNLSIYPCEKYDCHYLNNVFTTADTTYFLWTKKNDYRLYYPVYRRNIKFILLFDKSARYGTRGS